MTRNQGRFEGGVSRRERAQFKTERKEAEQRAHRRRRLLKKSAIGLIAAGGLGWLGYSLTTAKRLPPTGMADHIETSPPAHILTEPMPLAIQKHMLEHADGGGPPGVIINYNCVKFRCPEGMIERLAGIARSYPAFVYLAPFPDMDVKIAVTRLGEILVLDEVDERRIRKFIKG
jgi:hypothetical protein